MEGNVIYFQADARFNNWLLERINNKTVISYIIEKCRDLPAERIIWGGYECAENQDLIDEISRQDVDVMLSEEKDVNKRFIQIISELDYEGYVLRICGDQILIDVETTKNILLEMGIEEMDWFYEKSVASVLPDIVRIDVIKNNREMLKEYNRYFEGLQNLAGLKQKKLPYGMVPAVCRANSNEGFRICKAIIDSEIGIEEYLKRFCYVLQNPSGHLSASGLLGSWLLGYETDFFRDESGMVSAWWAESAVIFVKDHLKSNMRVFEYGCGNSTIFWSQYVNEVFSVEHDYLWFEKMKSIIPDNVKLVHVDLKYGDYAKSISRYGKFDIVLIDGRDRVNCARESVNCLTESGIIIWDDSDREIYREGFDYLRNCGFSRLDFKGVLFGLPGMCQSTTVFYRRDNCFEI